MSSLYLLNFSFLKIDFYLGHIVSNNGIDKSPKQLEPVRDWSVCITVTKVKSFLGCVGYHTYFIKYICMVAKSFNQFLRNPKYIQYQTSQIIDNESFPDF